MTGRARYGDLLRDTAGQIAVAMQRERFADRDSAKATASVYRDLLHLPLADTAGTR